MTLSTRRQTKNTCKPRVSTALGDDAFDKKANKSSYKQLLQAESVYRAYAHFFRFRIYTASYPLDLVLAELVTAGHVGQRTGRNEPSLQQLKMARRVGIKSDTTTQRGDKRKIS